MKIVTIVGARPQFIKAAAISRSIQEFNKRSKTRLSEKRRIQEILVHTGQHYDYLMDKVFFEELKLLKPDYHLGVGSGSHGRQTGMMLERIEAILQKENPKVILVYGDTNSTLAGALAAAKLNIPIAHVEAGLRSYNQAMPEEINRLLTDHLSTLLFCPTTQSVRNLLKEGIKNGETQVVKKVGDVMYDSILYYSKLAEEKSSILRDLDLLTVKTQNSKLVTHNYYLATLHRAENTDDPKKLKSIFSALDEIGEKTSARLRRPDEPARLRRPDEPARLRRPGEPARLRRPGEPARLRRPGEPVILPLHPRTKKMMKVYHLFSKFKNIKFIEPVSYLDMLQLEKNAKAILTDSGGVQKEAYWFGVPCFTLREETEWVETIKSKWNSLVGTETKRIVKAVRHMEGQGRYLKKREVFGNGKASQKIVKILVGYFG